MESLTSNLLGHRQKLIVRDLVTNNNAEFWPVLNIQQSDQKRCHIVRVGHADHIISVARDGSLAALDVDAKGAGCEIGPHHRHAPVVHEEAGYDPCVLKVTFLEELSGIEPMLDAGVNGEEAGDVELENDPVTIRSARGKYSSV